MSDLAGTYLALTWHKDSEGNLVPPGSDIQLSHEDAKLALEHKTVEAKAGEPELDVHEEIVDDAENPYADLKQGEDHGTTEPHE